MRKLIFIICVLFVAIFNIHAQDIFQAVKDSNLTKVKGLIEKDTSLLSLKDQGGRTAFHWAVANGNFEIASYLLSKGSNINNRNASLSTPLHAAASVNNVKMAEWLIEHGAEVDAKNSMGWTPLFWAARVGRKELIELLLDKGANMNLKDPYGLTPLNVALVEGNKETLEFFLDKGATINITGDNGLDLLRTAAEKGFVKMFNLVIEKGDRNYFMDEAQNRITMNKAVTGGSVEIVNALVAKGIPLELKADAYGMAPIHFAAEGGKILMLEYLVQKGADINQRTFDGKSAYNIAAMKKNTDLMNAIIKLGGSSDSQKFPILKNLYLGQKTPEKIPVIFAPGIISTVSHEFSSCFSPDGREFYFTRIHPELNHRVIMYSKLDNGTWTEPAIASFSGQDAFEPFLTPDNKRLYFQSGRVVGGALQMFTLYVERNRTGWGEVIDPGEPFNPMKTMHISATANGTLYTTDISGGMTARTTAGSSGLGSECLGIIKQVNGKYEKLEKIGSPLNKYPHSQHPWIAPHENYIIYTVTESGQQGKSSLYFSQKDNNGNWTEPKKIPLEINAGQPFVTPDEKYLFFTSMEQNQGNVYWVSTDILEELKTKE